MIENAPLRSLTHKGLTITIVSTATTVTLCCEKRKRVKGESVLCRNLRLVHEQPLAVVHDKAILVRILLVRANLIVL